MTVRDRVLAGERVRVRMRDQHENNGVVVYLSAGQIVYEVHDGFAAGVTEPVCYADSRYFEDSFMQTFEAVTVTA